MFFAVLLIYSIFTDSFFINGETIYEMLFQDISCPDAELGATFGIYSVADGDDQV